MSGWVNVRVGKCPTFVQRGVTKISIDHFDHIDHRNIYSPWSHHRLPPLWGGFVLMFLGSPVMLKYESTCLPSFFYGTWRNCKKTAAINEFS